MRRDATRPALERSQDAGVVWVASGGRFPASGGSRARSCEPPPRAPTRWCGSPRASGAAQLRAPFSSTASRAGLIGSPGRGRPMRTAGGFGASPRAARATVPGGARGLGPGLAAEVTLRRSPDTLPNRRRLRLGVRALGESLLILPACLHYDSSVFPARRQLASGRSDGGAACFARDRWFGWSGLDYGECRVRLLRATARRG